MHVRRRPGFIAGPNGPLFVLEMLPQARVPAPPVAVVCVAPFAEEMNKCRRMMALQAHDLAANGLPTLLFDFSGTGDSAGSFGEADVDRWKADATHVAQHALTLGARSIVWLGVRFGALLACHLARDVSTTAGIMCWQPAPSGRQIVNQFMRLQTAGRIVGGAEGPPPRETLAADGRVEIAGYDLSAKLIGQLERLDLGSLPERPARQLAWFEIATEPDQAPGPVAQRCIERWNRNGAPVEAAAVPGESFWSTVEISLAPALIERTTATVLRWTQHV